MEREAFQVFRVNTLIHYAFTEARNQVNLYVTIPANIPELDT